MCQYEELILSLNNDYAKQQRNYMRTLTNMYGLMVEFDPMRETSVAGGRNKGHNLRNMVADSEVTGDRDHGGGGGIGRKLECWHYGGGYLKRNCPKRAEEK